MTEEEWRKRIRTVAFKPHIFAFVTQASDALKVNFNLYVNKLLETAINTGQAGPIGERLQLEFARDKLITEERQLRRDLNAILRSGANLQSYAKKLLLGGQEEISQIRNRIGIYAHVSPRELDVILRILKRREDAVQELVETEDKLLPKNRYPIAISEKGWQIGQHSQSRDRVTNKQQQEGGEKTCL